MSDQSHQSPSSHRAPSPPEAEEFEGMIYALSLIDQNTPSKGKGALDPADSASPNLDFLSKPPPSTSVTSPPPSGSSDQASPGSESTEAATRFPSSFAAGSKKSAARLAAARAAQAVAKTSGLKPDKSTTAGWNSSDSDDDEDEDENENNEEEDEEEEEDGDDEEDERLKKHRVATAASQMTNDRERNNVPQAGREGIYSMYSTSGYPAGGVGGGAREMGQFSNPKNRHEIPSVLRDQAVDETETGELKPAFSEHGLLHRVMQERHERSARSLQLQAHFSGEPLMHINDKADPIQTGLLGAIANHQKDRKRDGGMGAALTERARERAYRQRETDEYYRQSMASMAGYPVNGYPAGYPIQNQAAMMQMFFDPGFNGLVNNPNNFTYDQLLFQQQQQQQFQIQQQAMMNAQQQYMNAYSTVGQQQQANLMFQQQQQQQLNGGGMMNGQQSVYGYPNQQMGYNQTGIMQQQAPMSSAAFTQQQAQAQGQGQQQQHVNHGNGPMAPGAGPSNQYSYYH
ncbi:hypothetical protein PSHT_12599 [Puccinia striiformis]|uniref:Uncharacterized protein n=1 Tax=Puccinia striiformis TaxID=27350 RepID=A0A2S4UVI0_9BASI|nr:hypothetical protein PSHT_12599 [Puccinia striiformis]